MDKNYTILHCHSQYSLLDSATDFHDYINEAVKNNMKAIAFTEHGNTFGWIEKKMACDNAGIKFIPGIECYLTKTIEEKERDNYHTILLAKNYQGFMELNRLVDLSTSESHFYYKPRISFEEFFNISDNIIKISACLASPLRHYRDDRDIFDRLCRTYDYYELQPHNNQDQIIYNLFLIELSKKYNKPLTVGTDTHSINSYKAECRKILMQAKNITFTSEDEFDLTFKTYSELIRMFEMQREIPEDIYMEAIENTNKIADMVESWDLDLIQKYPKVSDNDEEDLWDTIYSKYDYKVKNGIIEDNPQYMENIKEEMRVFGKINMHGFMLFMSQLMTWCRENNIHVGPGRGSVAGSTVAYITDITDVDPVKWRTVFSRFANEDRKELGD